MDKMVTVLKGIAAGLDPVRRAAIEVVADALSEEAADTALLKEELDKARADYKRSHEIALQRGDEIDGLVGDLEALVKGKDLLTRDRDELSILLDKESRDREAAEARAARHLKRAEDAEIQASRFVRGPTWRLVVRRDILTSHRRWAVAAYVAATGEREEQAERWVRNASEIGPAWPVVAEAADVSQTAQFLDILLNRTVAECGTMPCPTAPNDVRFEKN